MLLRRFLFLLCACFALGPPVMAQTQHGPFTLNAANQCAPTGVSGQATIFMNIAGTFSMTLQPKVAVQGQAAQNTQVTPTNSSTAQSTITAIGGYKADVASTDMFELCVSSYVSGSVVIYYNVSPQISTGLLGGNGGGGTVTGVTAGTGLSGGGTSGTVTVNLTTPVAAGNGGTGVANTATTTLGTANLNLATLGTGIVKNTTTTGALTDAAAADIYNLFTGCNGSSGLFLKDGGTCSAAGTGTVSTSGTPTNTQIAQFVSATVIQGISAATAFNAGTPQTTTGDLIGFTGGVPVRIAIGTTNCVAKAGSSGIVWSTLACENGTTFAYTGTGGYTGVSYGSNGSGAGLFAPVQGADQSGNAPCSNANTYCLEAPAAVTSYTQEVPGAQPASAGFMNCTAANPTVCSWVALGTIPSSAAFTSNGTSTLGYDTTAGNFHGPIAGADAIIYGAASALSINRVPKAGSNTQGLFVNSNISDSGTLMTYNGTGGLALTGTGEQFASTQGTLTTSSPFIAHTATWNAAAAFANYTSNVTCTAASAASTGFDYQLSGVSQFKLNYSGANCTTPQIVSTGELVLPAGTASAPNVQATGSASNTGLAVETTAGCWTSTGTVTGCIYNLGAAVSNTKVYGFSSTATANGTLDTAISRDAADVIDSGNGTQGDTSAKVQAAGFQSKGTKFTASGCSNSTTLGGASAGSFASGTTGTCTVTVTMGNTLTATNGWSCKANDLTTTADTVNQTATTTTTVTLSGTTVTGDLVNFFCMAY